MWGSILALMVILFYVIDFKGAYILDMCKEKHVLDRAMCRLHLMPVKKV